MLNLAFLVEKWFQTHYNIGVSTGTTETNNATARKARKGRKAMKHDNMITMMKEHNDNLQAFYEREIPELRKMCNMVVFDSELYSIYEKMLNDMMNQYIEFLYNALI